MSAGRGRTPRKPHQPKFPELPPKYSSSRELRNKAEKLRRDRLNNLLGEIKTLVPVIADKKKKSDTTRTNILRVSANYIRLQNLFPSEKFSSPGTPVINSLQHAQVLNGVVFLLSETGRILFISDSIEKHIGYTQLDMLGINMLEFLHPGDKSKLSSNLSNQSSHPSSTTHPTSSTHSSNQSASSSYPVSSNYRSFSSSPPLNNSRQTGFQFTDQVDNPFPNQSGRPFSNQLIDHYADQSVGPSSNQSEDPFADQSSGPFSNQSVDEFSNQMVGPFSNQSAGHYSDQLSDPFSNPSGNTNPPEPTEQLSQINLGSSSFKPESPKEIGVRKSFFIRIKEKNTSKSDKQKYEHMHVMGHIRASKEAEKKLSKDLEHVFVGIMKPVKDRAISEMSLVEAIQDQYITRHLPDGRIIYSDHRISTVAGYLPSDVHGCSAFNFMLGEDLPWTTLALRSMFASGNGEGLTTYRLRTKAGAWINLQSRGFLEMNKETGNIDHFLCINTLLSDEEAERNLEEQREKYTPFITELQYTGIQGLEKLGSGGALSLSIPDIGKELNRAIKADPGVVQPRNSKLSFKDVSGFSSRSESMSHSSTLVSRIDKTELGKSLIRRSILDLQESGDEKYDRGRKERSMKPEPEPVESKLSRQELVARAIGIKRGGSAPRPGTGKGGSVSKGKSSDCSSANAETLANSPGGIKRKHESDNWRDTKPTPSAEFLGLQDNEAILNQILLLSQETESFPKQENQLERGKSDDFGDVKIEDFLDFGSTKPQRTPQGSAALKPETNHDIDLYENTHAAGNTDNRTSGQADISFTHFPYQPFNCEIFKPDDQGPSAPVKMDFLNTSLLQDNMETLEPSLFPKSPNLEAGFSRTSYLPTPLNTSGLSYEGRERSPETSSRATSVIKRLKVASNEEERSEIPPRRDIDGLDSTLTFNPES